MASVQQHAAFRLRPAWIALTAHEIGKPQICMIPNPVHRSLVILGRSYTGILEKGAVRGVTKGQITRDITSIDAPRARSSIEPECHLNPRETALYEPTAASMLAQ